MKPQIYKDPMIPGSLLWPRKLASTNKSTFTVYRHLSILLNIDPEF